MWIPRWVLAAAALVMLGPLAVSASVWRASRGRWMGTTYRLHVAYIAAIIACYVAGFALRSGEMLAIAVLILTPAKTMVIPLTAVRYWRRVCGR